MFWRGHGGVSDFWGFWLWSLIHSVKVIWLRCHILKMFSKVALPESLDYASFLKTILLLLPKSPTFSSPPFLLCKTRELSYMISRRFTTPIYSGPRFSIFSHSLPFFLFSFLPTSSFRPMVKIVKLVKPS